MLAVDDSVVDDIVSVVAIAEVVHTMADSHDGKLVAVDGKSVSVIDNVMPASHGHVSVADGTMSHDVNNAAAIAGPLSAVRAVASAVVTAVSASIGVGSVDDGGDSIDDGGDPHDDRGDALDATVARLGMVRTHQPRRGS